MKHSWKYGRSAGLFLLLIFCGMQPGRSQHDNTFYLMHAVAQSNLLNPAVQPGCKWYMGIPGLVSGHLSAGNTAFTYRDLAEGDTWQLREIADRMHRSDLYGGQATLELFSLGYRYRSLYFNFNIGDRAGVYQTIPGDLGRMIAGGNGMFAGETAHFGGLRSSASYFREYSVSISKVVDQRWTAGIRAGLLFGKAALHTGRSELDFETGLYSFNLFATGNYILNASLPVTITQDAGGRINALSMDEIDYVSLLLNRKNPGISVDLGVVYNYDERTTFSASLLDLGFIRWRSDAQQLALSGSFEFTGVEPGTDMVSFGFLEDMADSVLNAVDLTVTQRAYTAFTPVQLYLGGTRRMNEHLTLGVVQRNMLLRNKLNASLTLLVQADLMERFLVSVSWSAMNHSVRNLGTGIAYHGKGFQFHLVSDNILGFLTPYDTRIINLRAGCNILFGCSSRSKSEKAESTYGKAPAAGDCSWSGNAGDRERAMKKARRKQNKL